MPTIEIDIPESVFQETVLQSNDDIQKENMLNAIDDFIIVVVPETDFSFRRTIDFGERGVLNLAFDKNADFLIIDDKKARNEAKEMGFKVLKTSTLLKRAEKLKLIDSYLDVITELEKLNNSTQFPHIYDRYPGELLDVSQKLSSSSGAK